MNTLKTARVCQKKLLSTMAFFVGFLMGSPAMANPPTANPMKEIVTDRISGTAIMGYDPVAYFTNNTTLIGSPRFEVEWNGVVWRFANAANKAAFQSAPAVYAPQNGGYDPVGVDRGQMLPGNPYIFAVQGQQVYLFASKQNRTRFLNQHAQAHIEQEPVNDNKALLYVNANGRRVSLTKDNVSVLLSAIPVP